MDKIFKTILDWHFRTKKFSSEIQELSTSIISSIQQVYRGAISNLLPTPKKSHYTFNLRDFSRVVQGLCLSIADSFTNPQKVTRLLFHEIYRVFYDRLVDSEDCKWLFEFTQSTISKVFKQDFQTIFSSYKVDGNVTDDSLRNLIFSTLSEKMDKIKYDEIESLDVVTKKIEAVLIDYNVLSKKPMDLVLFRFAIEHLTRIVRVLQQPQGSMLLVGVGGSGRQSLAKLAAHLCDISVIQIEITRGYNQENWYEDIKKILRVAGVNGTKVAFILNDSQIPDEGFLEDISNILNSGEVPSIFPTDEKMDIIESMRKILRGSSKDSELTNNQLFGMFVDRCKSNLHIMLCMSPIGNGFRIRLRKFPSLINCCTIDWFREWPNDALEMVATKYLKDCNLPIELESSVVQLCKHFHMSTTTKSEEYLSKARRFNYVTPTSYLELIQTFKRLYANQSKILTDLKNRYVNGLDKLDFAQKAVAVMQVDLAELQPQLLKTQIETDEIMVLVEAESISVQSTKAIVQVDEESASIKAAEAKAIKEDCEAQLAEAIPALQAALEALDTCLILS